MCMYVQDMKFLWSKDCPQIQVMQKELIVLYSKHIVHGGKVQNVKIFKNYHYWK